MSYDRNFTYRKTTIDRSKYLIHAYPCLTIANIEIIPDEAYLIAQYACDYGRDEQFLHFRERRSLVGPYTDDQEEDTIDLVVVLLDGVHLARGSGKVCVGLCEKFSAPLFPPTPISFLRPFATLVESLILRTKVQQVGYSRENVAL